MMSVLNLLLDLLNVWTCLVVLSIFLATYFCFRRPKNLPPGPRGWPIVGSLPSIAKTDSLHLEFMKWQKKYGSVVYFRMGMLVRTLHAIVGPSSDGVGLGFAKARKAFARASPDFRLVKITIGLGLTPFDPHWKEQRKFALTTLRSFGFGKRSLEVKISDESIALRKELNNMGNKPFDIARLLQKATTNIICSLVFAHRFEYDNLQFLQLMHVFDEFASSNLFAMPENIFPFLTHVLNSGDKLMTTVQYAHDYIRVQVRQHEETFDPNDIRDFIDSFLLEMKTQNQSDSSFTEDQLLQAVFDLFVAGTDTTATTLRWASLLMMVNPDYQRKVHEEVDSVLGKGQPPSMSHRAQMPYTQAVLTETARFATIFPQSLPHATTEDTDLNGYHIPKNCMVFPSIWSVHHDEKLFPQPDKFDPTRFLDDDGQFKKDDHVLPFSAGPRSCLGEQLAKMELFLFFTSLMQHFTFKLPEGAPAPSLKGRVGITHSPKHFVMIAAVRD